LRAIPLKSSSSDINRKHVIDINWADSWQVYQRLQELDIPSIYETNRLLTVGINNPKMAIQIWSIVKQFTAFRQDLISNLENCCHHLYTNSM
jgi:hypothetical protein